MDGPYPKTMDDLADPIWIRQDPASVPFAWPAPEFSATVLIATHNRSHCLPRCLDSILEQTLAPRQIIVVDDGSTDRTPEVVWPYRDRVQYYRIPSGGKSKAVNFALEKVAGEYLWIFDDDDVALPTALESHARAFSRNPEAGFTYSSFYNGRLDAAGRLCILSEQKIPDIPENRLFSELLLANFTKGQPATVVRTSCYRDVGPFDEALPRSQDYEILLRLARRFPAVGVRDFTFVKRIDSAARAPGRPPTPAHGRSALWRTYDAEIFRKLHRELAPADYLPERAPGAGLSPSDERLFRLRRMAMMAKRDLWDEALADLAAFVSMIDAAGREEPSAEETRLLRLATADRLGAAPKIDRDRIAALRRVVSNPGGARVRAILRRGLWRGLVASLRRRRLRTSAAFARLVVQL